MSVKFTKKARAGAALTTGLLMLMLVAGCGGVYAVTGDNPARITLDVTASMSQRELDNALSRADLVSPFVVWSAGEELRGPFWDYGLYLVGNDGSYIPLRPVGDIQLSRVPAKTLKAKVTFLAPPGTHRFKLLVDGYYEHWSGISIKDIVSVKTYGEEKDRTLSPGAALKIKRVYGPK